VPATPPSSAVERVDTPHRKSVAGAIGAIAASGRPGVTAAPDPVVWTRIGPEPSSISTEPLVSVR
jgi:hypothetical protein